ncbi:carbohydrate ABC transporter permease [Falsiroseomonas sp. HW251]|uniref:carbohydrate ABC transporter permease n=1 Tax=Falsiroseomonas sp. HW251 TaxID=3390998 RepID=UPI003D31EE1C
MERGQGRLALLLTYGFLCAAAFSILLPLALMLLNSLRSNFEIYMDPIGLPDPPDWGVYARAWEDGGLGQAFLNSLRISGLTILAVCTTASMAAWALARRSVPGWMTISLYFLATTTIPIQLFLFPLFFLFAKLGLINHWSAVVLVYTAIYTPFSLFLLRTYVLAIPVELEEAARIDGAGEWAVFRRVVLPMLTPGLLTVALIVGLNSWNEFIIGITFLQHAEAATVVARFYQLSGRYQNDWPQMMAAATLIALPVVVFFILLQRRFIEGISSGAVKG